MELLDTLASIGLTTKVLQIIIIGSIGIVLAGLFWRFIVIGAGIVFIVFVLTMPSKAGSIVTGIEKEAEKVEESRHTEQNAWQIVAKATGLSFALHRRDVRHCSVLSRRMM